MTCNIWHVTHDTWHMTCDMWGVNILYKVQLPSSYGVWFMIFWKFGGKGSQTEWMTDEGVCRTAPATHGLLKTIPGNLVVPDQYEIQSKKYHFCQVNENGQKTNGIIQNQTESDRNKDITWQKRQKQKKTQI